MNGLVEYLIYLRESNLTVSELVKELSYLKQCSIDNESSKNKFMIRLGSFTVALNKTNPELEDLLNFIATVIRNNEDKQSFWIGIDGSKLKRKSKGCAGKQQHLNLASAQKALEFLVEEYPDRFKLSNMNAYTCDKCNYAHIGHKSKRIYKQQ